MKLRASKKELREGYYRIISIGYCDAQRLLNYEKAFAYSAGVYGWACDYYDIDGVLISTGYSPLSNKNVKKYDYNILREYEATAGTLGRKGRRVLLNEFIKNVIKDGER